MEPLSIGLIGASVLVALGLASLAALKGWTFEGPRGPIKIDAETRDIVQNIYIMRVVKEGDRIGTEVIDRYEMVADPCKELKVGKCGG